MFIKLLLLFGPSLVFGESITNYYTTYDETESCVGRCHVKEYGLFFFPVNNSQAGQKLSPPCSCAIDCMTTSKCCTDYFSVCWKGQIPSCEGKCANVLTNLSSPCQCGEFCMNKDSCCPDYIEKCLLDRVSDEEIQDMAEALLFWDRNSLSDAITVQLQEKTDASCDTQNSFQPLLSFNTSVLNFTNTYFMLANLYDDYIPDTSLDEILGVTELTDVYNFLNPIVRTKVMEGVENFLVSKGFVARERFENRLHDMWFNFYNRSKTSASFSSSGFEHVFLGEWTGNKAGGFHNWVRFLTESINGNIVYNGYLDYLKLSDKASVVNVNFKWLDKCKQSSSFFIGTSPEFELALYTLCWFTRPNSKCPIMVDGNSFSIQTYQQIDTLGRRLVASAYPVFTSHGSEIQSKTFIIISMFIIVYFNVVQKLYL